MMATVGAPERHRTSMPIARISRLFSIAILLTVLSLLRLLPRTSRSARPFSAVCADRSAQPADDPEDVDRSETRLP